MFSRSYLDDHCLGILFSNRIFVNRILGLAWKGDARKKSGICQKRTRKRKLQGPTHHGYMFHLPICTEYLFSIYIAYFIHFWNSKRLALYSSLQILRQAGK